MYRSLLQSWLRNAAKEKIREEVARAAENVAQPPSAESNSREQPGAAGPQISEPKPCHLGVVFALGIESGGFEDVLDGVVSSSGGGFVIREGGLNGRRVVLIRSEAGPQNAARATEILIAGHHPGRVVSAGLAGGLSPELKRNDIIVADRLLSINGGDMAVELPSALAAAAAQSPARIAARC